MATASVTNSFTNGTPADASEVNANFSDVTSFLNNSVVHRDGSKAMTGALDAGSNKIVNVTTPTADNDAANKVYVDTEATQGQTARFHRGTNLVIGVASGTVTFEDELNDTDGWWSSGDTLTCPTTGVYLLCVRVDVGSYTGSGMSWTLDGGNFEPGLSILSTNSDNLTFGGPAYMMSGATLQLDYTNGTGSATITDVWVTITKIATF